MNQELRFLEHKAYKLRESSLIMTTRAGSGHPTSCLSAADLVAALFFHTMRYDPKNPKNLDNDRFILSKGHAAPLLYGVYKELGILSDHDLTMYRNINSVLEGHPTRRFAYTESATGALGMGLSIGTGIALSAKLDKQDFKTFVLLGDSECSEGQIWEAAELAAFYKLNNLIAIMDCNRLGQSTQTMHGHHTHRYEEKFKAFGWHVIVIEDGHDMQHIVAAFNCAVQPHDTPVMVIAKTIKGYGVKESEDQEGFHGKAFSKEDLNEILQQLSVRFAKAQDAEKNYTWHPQLPPATMSTTTISSNSIELPDPCYQKGNSLSTREAWGKALVALGSVMPSVVSLDAEVKNSTYADIFEKKFPNRFFQCFIAEQNMVSMAVGFESRGHVPFVSTFGAFMSHAHDQIRMAAISQSALRLVGSHAGVSVGQDGPSQMALEDIATMRCLPESIVLYPCDSVSTHKLVEHMANYNKGISYLRTTRGATQVIYDWCEQFPIGGCKILRASESDVACIVAAGITVFEALKAHEMLQEKGVSVAVVDLYSVKPLDVATLSKLGTSSGSTIITVEDHYLQGGLGQAVAAAVINKHIYVHSLAVTALPRSGKPEELLNFFGIDAENIVKKVLSL